MPSLSPYADPAAILITGASSGLGAAMAQGYARVGVTLFLTGRDESRLAKVAQDCRERGADVSAETLDVTDSDALAAWIEACDRRRPLDLVIANAGISAGTADGTEGVDQTRAIFAVNLNGVVNTVMPAVAVMRPRRRGQIAIMSSMAGFRGIGGAPAYCASKAAVRVWGEALRGALASDGLAVSVICPGFVATPMTDVNRFTMPLLMEADAAARLIRRKLATNTGRIAFPWPMAALSWIAAALPDALADRLTRRLPAKG
ncbi:SDR family NAD(P)-dependent oxidoreductase [Magnetospirillum molischianum]|uniref:Short-chain dehydrogenase/reductase (SDR) superfamily n=1 Tax=Magnetospirillum molischianum DSM 120 TaxID=1150626 RepID=H8FPT8_MAGML|nr:SDR family NAD(P)-dependent oxidoreductase [Magnetospirillum molischianum]CCG40376.1 Short-chain dehydrogenase/reductase (SDR) superfamily [Magnetospirillum molischianum DSM 120]